MAESDKLGGQRKLQANLKRWAETGDLSDTRTVIFRVTPNVDIEALCRELGEFDVEVTSSGAAVIVGTISRRDLVKASELKDIIRIEQATRLSPRDNDPKADLLSFGGSKSFRLPDK